MYMYKLLLNKTTLGIKTAWSIISSNYPTTYIHMDKSLVSGNGQTLASYIQYNYSATLQVISSVAQVTHSTLAYLTMSSSFSSDSKASICLTHSFNYSLE